MLADEMEKLCIGEQWSGFNVKLGKVFLWQFDAWRITGQHGWYISAAPPVVCGETLASTNGVGVALPASPG